MYTASRRKSGVKMYILYEVCISIFTGQTSDDISLRAYADTGWYKNLLNEIKN